MKTVEIVTTNAINSTVLVEILLRPGQSNASVDRYMPTI